MPTPESHRSKLGLRSTSSNAISNSNWTEWSTIQGVIAQVIQNRTSGKREADLKLRARLLPELYDTRSNCYLIVSLTNFGVKNVF